MKGTNLELEEMRIVGKEERHNSSKLDQDVLFFFEGGDRYKSKSAFTNSWVIEDEPKSNPPLTVEPTKSI